MSEIFIKSTAQQHIFPGTVFQFENQRMSSSRWIGNIIPDKLFDLENDLHVINSTMCDNKIEALL